MVGPRHNRRGSPGADLENLGRGEAAEEGFARVCGIRTKGPIPPCTLPLVKLGPRALMGTALASGALVGDQCRLAARPESEDRSRGALHPGRQGRFARIELEHRHLDRYGARRDEMRGIFDSEGGWNGLLASFARAVAAA